jgi:hypothetical protein
LGVGAGCMFYYEDVAHNVMGVVLLMLANFCDSTDGQMARLTGKKTLIGRMLDGFSGDVWFFAIYVAIALRLYHQNLPFTHEPWGWSGWVLCCVAGFLMHAPQSSLADYYRQIHLFFLKGEAGSEFDHSAQQQAVLKGLPEKGAFWAHVFYRNYANYCKSQEKRTPAFQQFFQAWQQSDKPEAIREAFLQGSRPLMKYTNLLTFNLRAIVCYVACLTNEAWIYPLFEITVMQGMYVYMHRRHEQLCRELTTQLDAPQQNNGATKE